MKHSAKEVFSVHNMVTVSILAAVASILFLFEFPIFPAVPFYKLDFSNIPALLGAFSMGPIQGVVILLIKALIGLLHSSTGGVGELADFIMGAAMIVPAGLIYRFNRSRKGAVISMVAGGLLATVVGVFTNLWVLIPFYSTAFGMPIDAIVAMGTKMFPSVGGLQSFVWLVTGPFNVIKWTAISVITGIIYKPLSPMLHGKKRGARA